MVVLNSVKYDSRVKREAAVIGQRHDVVIIGMADPEGPLPTFSGPYRVKLIRLKTRGLRKNIWGWGLKYLEFTLRALALLLRQRPRIVHCHDLSAVPVGYMYRVVSGAAVIFDSHELYLDTDGASRDPAMPFWRRFQRWVLPRVQGVIAANESRAILMRDEYGAPELPLVILNVPDINPKRRSLERSSRLREYLVSKSVDPSTIVVYQGSNALSRGLAELVEATRSWSAGVVLVIIGIGGAADQNRLETIVRESGLSERVFFHPPVEGSALVEFLSSADIGVVIYKNTCRNNYYCAPNKIFEYAAARLAIVGSDFPEISSLVSRYGLGATFDPSRSDSIARAVNDVAARLPQLRAEARFDELEQQYNWGRESEKLLDLYLSLLPGTPHPRAAA